MIRLRKKNGEVVDLGEDVNFVELCDVTGDPGIVFYQAGTLISQITPNTPESSMYSKKFDCKFVKVIDLKDRYEGKNERFEK